MNPTSSTPAAPRNWCLRHAGLNLQSLQYLVDAIRRRRRYLRWRWSAVGRSVVGPAGVSAQSSVHEPASERSVQFPRVRQHGGRCRRAHPRRRRVDRQRRWNISLIRCVNWDATVHAYLWSLLPPSRRLCFHRR